MSNHPTTEQVVRRVETTLAEAGVLCPTFDARCLVAEVLFAGDLNRLPLERSQTVTEDQLSAAEALTRRRVAGQPLQYIVGYTDFMGLRLGCDRRALIPRPETELLAEAVIKTAQELKPTPTVAADIGTGSGVLAVALAANLPHLERIYATDVSGEALSLADENVTAHNLQGCITLLEGPDLEPLWRAGVADQVDLIVTNPPYVGAEEIPGVQTEVRDQEPREALVDLSGSGLGFYQRVIPRLSELPALRLFACEVGAGMAEAVGKLVAKALPGWTVRTEQDYPEIDWIVLAYVS